MLIDARTIRWNPAAAIRLDVAEFERLAAEPKTVGAAVDVYGGDLAAQLDEDWLVEKREHLRQLQSRLLWGLVESRRNQNDADGAIVYAQRLMLHDPWREDGIRALLELRHATGDRAGALRLYHDFVGRLRGELGVEPMTETTAVYDRVLAGRDRRRPDGVSPASEVAPPNPWSFERLSPLERRLLNRVGIFAGGWSLDAVTAVCSDAGVAALPVVDTLASLVGKSLVTMDCTTLEDRYYLPETVRSQAFERLVQTEEYGSIARRHAQFYVALAVRNDNTWGATRSHGDLELFARDLDNYRTALAWSIDVGKDLEAASSLIAALRWAFASRALNAETVRWCDRALAALGLKAKPSLEAMLRLALAGSMGTMPFYPRFHYYRAVDGARFASTAERAFELLKATDENAPRRALALSLAALHLQLAGETRSESLAASGLSIARNCGDPVAIAMALYACAFAIDPGESTARIALLTEALNLARPVSNLYHSAVILHALGEVAFAAGDPAKALAYAQQSVAEQRGHAPINQAQSHISGAAYCLRLGRIDEARMSAQYALTVARRIGEPMIAAAALQHVAGIAVACHDPGRAAQLLGASDAQRAGKPPRLFTEQSGYERTRLQIRERISDDKAVLLMGDGFAWTTDEAIEHAMIV
jgi:hypothetical protein